MPRHVERGSGGYDGQFYAELAVDPLLRDPAVDRALDAAPFRARRILFSWTAYGLGLGRPSWILQAYALQNAIAWLVLAFVLLRWFPPDSVRDRALWFASLFNIGLIWSVRYSLLDGPSLLLLALAMAAVEGGRLAVGALLVGIAGLGRETNLLAIPALVDPTERRARAWLVQIACVGLAMAPLLVWIDYLYSVYRTLVFTAGNTMGGFLHGYLWLVQGTWNGLVGYSLSASKLFAVFAVVAVTVQSVTMLARPVWSSPWWRMGCAYVGLFVFLGPIGMEGDPGTFLRLVLPLSLAFNVLIPRDAPWFWPVAAAGNLTVFQGIAMLWEPAIRRFL